MPAESSALALSRRTCCCGQPRKADVGKRLILKGWVHRRRDHGGVYFIDLRDRYGLCQAVFSPATLSAEAYEAAQDLRNEYVLAVEGTLLARSEDTVNPKMDTGEVELRVERYEVLNTSKTPPFKLDEYSKIGEETRLRYRYLDLRRPEMQHNILQRHVFFQTVRNFLSDHGFLEIETPCLAKSTPEGARDFLVPSRLNPGKFYALPQSPQLFKQILMVSGCDRYFQLARCFRDEDLRANRTLEFTQIDIEMSFIQPDDLFEIIEGMLQAIFQAVRGEDLPIPFPRMTYDEAMLKYGSDKPDLRFGLEIRDAGDCFAQGCEFKVFANVLQSGGVIRALRLPGGADKYSNTQLKPDGDLNRFVQRYGAKGLAWFRCVEGGKLESSIAKFFDEACQARLVQRVGAKPGDLIALVADKPNVAAAAMGQLRLRFAEDCNLIDKDIFRLAWITDFPLVEWNDKEKRWDPAHHPFTTPHHEDMALLATDIGRARALAYDLAMNGVEIGGGSIRIHRSDIQAQVFEAIGISPEEAEAKFGFFLEALRYGAPPHGGIAFGVDRMLMLLLGEESNREVIPFPTNQSGQDLMTGAPSAVDDQQLAEVFIASTWVEEEKEPVSLLEQEY
ncbi:MAG: aspartate--tRNA ligase, partial [Candidatus Sumerlaeota bacterium]|nr:aspartate--tRNA ligase [Candidatus Sumerlaeota bacterium]